MKLFKNIIFPIILLSISSIHLIAQNQQYAETITKETLKTLTKVTENELMEQDIMIDGETIPVYNLEGKRIREMEIMNAMMSGDLIPDFYKDKNNKISVISLRKASLEEKAMMMQMQAQMEGENVSIGQKATAFDVTDINGNKYSLDSLNGKIIVMNFWFVGCKPCVMEMPELNALVEKYKDKEVVFLGFCTSKKDKIASFLNTTNFDYEIVPITKDYAFEYGVVSYPTHIVIDENSKIVFSTSGLGPDTIHNIEKAIDDSLKE